MRHAVLTVVRMAALGSISLALAACDNSNEPVPEPIDRILFETQRDGVPNPPGPIPEELYVVNVDGTGLTNLTNLPAKYYDPRLSPDGTQILFWSDRVGCYNVWIMGADGSGLDLLTDGPADRCNEASRWSPDGTLIAFTSSRDINWDIYIMQADGSGATRLTDDPAMDLTHYTWSGWYPDGTRILFGSNRDGDTRIFSMNVDGTDAAPFFGQPGDYEHRWSPTGARIAFERGAGAGDVYVMNADGSGLVNVTDDPADDWLGCWSPDGTRLLFVTERDGDAEIYVVNADGTGALNLTNHAAADTQPAWSPDGTRIAFVSDREGNRDVYLMNADGTGVTRLTSHARDDYGPVWLPPLAAGGN